MARALRAWPAAAAAPPLRCGTAAFSLVLLALFLQLTVSSNLLFVLGIPYDVPGGLPFFKLHPATYLIALALTLVLASDGRPALTWARITRGRSGLDWFIACMALCTAVSLGSVGVSGAAISIESYIAAWALAMVLAAAAPRQIRLLRTLLIVLLTANVLLGLAEAVIQRHTVPIYVDGEPLPDLAGEFRPHALFDHPLTAAMGTMTGLFVVLSTRLAAAIKAALVAAMLVGLLAWGGRTALAVTILVLAGMGAAHVTRATVNRTLTPALALAVAALAVAVPIAFWYLLSETSIGERIARRLYLDDSATSRTLQFRILGLLTLKEAVFGVTIERLSQLAFVLSLRLPFEEIESPWLLAYLHLGVFGFAAFLLGFARYVRHLWRAGPLIGKVLVASLLVVASTSNSLGRKSNILVLLTAAVYATAAGERTRPPNLG